MIKEQALEDQKLSIAGFCFGPHPFLLQQAPAGSGKIQVLGWTIAQIINENEDAEILVLGPTNNATITACEFTIKALIAAGRQDKVDKTLLIQSSVAAAAAKKHEETLERGEWCQLTTEA